MRNINKDLTGPPALALFSLLLVFDIPGTVASRSFEDMRPSINADGAMSFSERKQRLVSFLRMGVALARDCRVPFARALTIRSSARNELTYR